MDTPTPTITPPTNNKFTADEMKQLADIREGHDKATVAFGKFALQKIAMEKAEAQLRSEFDLLEAQEKEFLDKIVAKYGEGQYDPTTGVFTPKKKV